MHGRDDLPNKLPDFHLAQFFSVTDVIHKVATGCQFRYKVIPAKGFWKNKIEGEVRDAVFPNVTNVKSWPNGFSRRCKSTQVCKTRTCARTQLPWVTKRIASSRKSQSAHIQFTCNQLVSTCVRIWARPKSTQVGGQTKRTLNASRRKKLALRVVQASKWSRPRNDPELDPKWSRGKFRNGMASIGSWIHGETILVYDVQLKGLLKK